MHINGIDKKDNEIINLLLKDARMTYSDIGEKVGLSRTAVKNRVALLEKKGIIGGYRAIINPQESPEMMTFIVNIETKAEYFKHLFAKKIYLQRLSIRLVEIILNLAEPYMKLAKMKKEKDCIIIQHFIRILMAR